LKIFLDSMGGGAWPFLVGGVICLVNFVNERDLSPAKYVWPTRMRYRGNRAGFFTTTATTCSTFVAFATFHGLLWLRHWEAVRRLSAPRPCQKARVLSHGEHYAESRLGKEL
jgi:hypothetical protein